MAINKYQTGERGKADVLNRPWEELLSQSGHADDGSDFEGFEQGADIRAYGAVPGEDSTAAFLLAAASGKQVTFRRSTLPFIVTQAIPLAAGTEFRSKGTVEIQVPAGSTFRVLDIDGVDGVRIVGDFRFTKASGASLTGNAHAVSIRGNAQDILVDGVRATGFVRGFNVAGHEGTVSGTSRRVTFRYCHGHDSPSNFGFNFEHCDTVTLDNCYGRGNWLDGAKLQRSTLNVTVRGGAYVGNGVGYLTDPALYAGDGLDAYAGGDTFVIDGTIFEDNYGNGVTIKTGGLNETEAATYGYVRNVQLYGLRCRNNLVGQGAYLALNDPGTMTQPVLAHVTIHGGLFTGNPSDGIYYAGRNGSFHGTITNGNGRNGISIATRAFGVELFGCVSLANTMDNLNIAGKKVAVWGGTFLGVEADDVSELTDLASLPVVSRNGIRVEETADDIVIHEPWCEYSTTSPALYVLTTGACTVHHRPRTSAPSAIASYGGVGSTYRRTDGSGSAVHYTKTSGAANTTTGWTRTALTALPNRAVSAVQTSFAHGLGYTPSVVIITPQSDVRAWESAAADSTNIYITASGAGTVDIHYQ